MTSARWWRSLAAACLLTCVAGGLVRAQAPAATPLPPGLEQEARQLERMLIAPCCWMQPVSEHQSQASEDVKQQIRVLLVERLTREQVLDAFVKRYGVRILAEPPNAGIGRWLYLAPIAVFGISAFGLVAWVRRMAAARPAAVVESKCDEAVAVGVAGPSTRRSTSTAEERLDDELREMD